MVESAEVIWADGPSSAPSNPPKVKIRAWGKYVETAVQGAAAGATIYDSKADMDADTSQAANAMAWVLGDDTAANNGVYQFDGTSTWTRRGDLPYSYIQASNAGTGTANAIVATTSIPVPAADGAALIALPIVADNTGAVTVAFNGGTALTIKTSAGNDITAGGLTAGMIVSGYVSGATFRMLSDQASAAIQTAAEAAAAAAAASAAGVNLPSIQNGDAYKRLVVTGAETGYELRDNDHVDLLDYATSATQRTAIKNGSTAIDSVWSDAADDAVARGFSTIYIPDGNYEVDDDEYLLNPGLIVRGNGRSTRIKKNGLGQIFSAQQDAPTISGGALDADSGANSVVLATGLGAGFSVGQSCLLVDETAINSAAGDKQAQMVTIQAISGDTITFWETLCYSFTTAATARLVPLTLLAGVGYRDLRLVMDDTIVLESSLTYNPNFGIDLQFCEKVLLDSIEITNAVGAMISVRGCKGVIGRGLLGFDGGSTTSGSDDPDSDEGTGGWSYGVMVTGLNQGILVEGSYWERCRHAVTTAGFYSSIFNYGEPVGLTVSGCRAHGMKNAAFDTHQAGRDITYIGCGASNGHFLGFQVRAFSTRLLGCSAENMLGAAVQVRGSQATGLAGDRCHISDFTAVRTNRGTVLGTDYTQYGAIMDEGFDTFIEGLRTIECGGPAITLGRNGIGKRTVYKDIDALDMCNNTINPSIVHIIDTNVAENVWIDGLNSVSTNGKVTDLVKVDSSDPVVHLRNVDGIGHTGQKITTVSPLNVDDRDVVVNPGRVRMEDDFLGNSLSEVWRTAKGSNGTAALPAIFTKDGGMVRLVTGADASGTMDLNGSQLCSTLNWRASGAAVFEARIMINAITNVAVFFGFTDQVSVLEMPFTLGAGDALTSNASDAVGVLFDTGADTDNWWLVGVKAGTAATKQNTTVAPVASTYEIWKIMLTAAGVATFYRNGAKIGTAMANAITANLLISPVVAAFSRGAASRNIDVDWIKVEQVRL